MLLRGNDITQSLPTITLYALAGYRLLPSLQRVFASATKLKHSYPVMDIVFKDLSYNKLMERQISSSDEISILQKGIKYDNLSYRYKESDRMILKNINFEIKKGQTAAFVGSTGDGKTTLIDLMVGLLESDKDQILIDDAIIYENNDYTI